MSVLTHPHDVLAGVTLGAVMWAGWTAYEEGSV